MSPIEPHDSDESAARILDAAADLRQGLLPLLAALAGTPPRPVRLTRRIGLDKSLASRLVQAARAESDLRFLALCPSPTGLRILLDKGRADAEGALLHAAAAAVERFESLLDSLPGGRQALDAHLSERSSRVQQQREHVARQASFKAVSFLFGHYCDTLSTTLLLLPSAQPGWVDMVEIHRRLGLHRLRADTAMPLMSLNAAHAGAPPIDRPYVSDLRGDASTRRPEDFLLAEGSSEPLPALQVVDEGSMVSFVLEPATPSRLPTRLSSAMRVTRVAPLSPEAGFDAPRRYMLHLPCRSLVRDILIADDLWTGAQLQVDFYLPGPSGSPDVVLEPGKPHHRRLHLSCHVEALPAGEAGHALEEAEDQAQVLRSALVRAGIPATTRFRGWRCRMTYPLPLVEMQIGFRFSNQPGSR